MIEPDTDIVRCLGEGRRGYAAGQITGSAESPTVSAEHPVISNICDTCVIAVLRRCAMTSGSSSTGTHIESEDHPWSVYISDHPQRTESHWFTEAKRTAHKILADSGQDRLPY